MLEGLIQPQNSLDIHMMRDAPSYSDLHGVILVAVVPQSLVPEFESVVN